MLVSARPAAPDPPAGFALFLVAFLLSPLVLVCWAAAQGVLKVTGWPRWRVGAAAVASGAAVIWLQGGPVPALAAHFSGFQGLVDQVGAPAVQLPPLGALLAPQVALSVPAGLLTASLTRRPDLAVPDPGATVRDQRRQVKLERKGRALAVRSSETNPHANIAPLGVSLGGDLPGSWRSGRFVLLPDHAGRLPRLAIGQPGAGKTVYLTRETHLAALAGRRVIFLDGKGDRHTVQAITDAYCSANPDASIHVFPDQPLDGWRGDAAAQVNRMLGCWQWSLESDWYKQQATLALRLACSAPGPRVDCMGELVRRLDSPTLARLWAKQPTEAALVKMLTPDLPSICIRLANLAAAIASRLDGTVAIGEADLTIVSLPVMANPTDAEDLFRALMADVSHWISVRKDARPALVVCDEFSALSGGREAAIHVMERGRSFGVPSILSGQSYASLGSPEDADRIVSAANTLVLFASSTPDELSRLAGSVQTAEAVYQVEDGRWTGRASLTSRARHRVDPNTIRQLQPGQCVLVSGGHAEKLQVIRPPAQPLDPRPPRPAARVLATARIAPRRPPAALAPGRGPRPGEAGQLGRRDPGDGVRGEATEQP